MVSGKFNLASLGLFCATGMAVGGYFIGQTMYNAKVAVNVAEAKGLAERVVESDIATWQISYRVSAKTKREIPRIYKEAEKQQSYIIQLLLAYGFKTNELSTDLINYDHTVYRDKNKKIIDQRHSLSGSVTVTTHKVHSIAQARSIINKLIIKGFDITNHHPNYLFTKLNEIKPEMLSEATKNARISANEFAKDASVKVGGIRNARQGNFNIRDIGSSYCDTRAIKKNVRVVTTITFYLTE